MEYIIVKVEWPNETEQLVKKVQSKIEEGFEPLGGMATWDNGPMGSRSFTQTMVRHANTWEISDQPETVGDKFIRGFMGRERSNES